MLTLAGIFLLLAWNSAQTFGGGIELQPLTEAERGRFTAQELDELDALAKDPPSPVRDFLLAPVWAPDSLKAPRYGVLAMVVSTLMTALLALLIATPIGIAVASWLTFEAKGRLRQGVKLVVELLAAVPSVVADFIGIQLVAPIIARIFGVPGGLNALNGAVLLAIMALRTIVSLAEDALAAVPRSFIQGSLALGATRWQTLRGVALPTARSGLFAATMLGMGRAVGETMTVLMVCGNAVAMPGGVLDPVRTLTATIAIELGEVPQGTTHFYGLFAVGLLLFPITLPVNLAADAVQRRQSRMLGNA